MSGAARAPGWAAPGHTCRLAPGCDCAAGRPADQSAGRPAGRRDDRPAGCHADCRANRHGGRPCPDHSHRGRGCGCGCVAAAEHPARRAAGHPAPSRRAARRCAARRCAARRVRPSRVPPRHGHFAVRGQGPAPALRAAAAAPVGQARRVRGGQAAAKPSCRGHAASKRK